MNQGRRKLGKQGNQCSGKERERGKRRRREKGIMEKRLVIVAGKREKEREKCIWKKS